MNPFDPRTCSGDWEILVVDKLGRCVDDTKLLGFAQMLSSECDMPVHVDWNSLEFGLGINHSFEQLWNRILNVTDRATQMLHEFDLEPFPAGSHPVDWMYNSGHIHIGTIHDEVQAAYIMNQLMKYLPVFAALGANSPITHGLRGEFKSYRVENGAHGCVIPCDSRNPHSGQGWTWSADVSSKIIGKPTIEVRVPDGPSSRRFMAEIAVFIAAFTHHMSNNPAQEQVSPVEYKRYLYNRWAASKYGLQATFDWNGSALPVAEIMAQMLDECQTELQTFGIKPSDLTIINMMVEKRICQADFVISFMDRYPDDYCLASTWGKFIRHWEIFDEYVEKAQALEPIALADEESVIAEHLAYIGEGTSLWAVRQVMWYPASAAEEVVSEMIRRGMITDEVTATRGRLLHRTDA